jgi:uncharacterized damage-inducible protein DinB
MKETDRIHDQLQRAYEGNAWHGPAVKEVLAGVSAGDAAARPLPAAHSIWELVLHMTAWSEIVRRRLKGERFDITPEIDWPPVPTPTESAWNEAQSRLEREQAALRRDVAALPESRLDEIAVEGGPSVYILLHGVVQHHLYHAGQIVILKKGLHPKAPAV